MTLDDVSKDCGLWDGFVSTRSSTVLFSQEGYDSHAPELPEKLHWCVKYSTHNSASWWNEDDVVFTVIPYFNIKLLDRL